MTEKTIVAKTFVINSQNLILTMRRGESDPRRPGTWDIPGGGVEYGEDPTSAVIRETYEEAGIKIEKPQIFYVSSVNENDYVIRLIYYVHTHNENVHLSFEHDQSKWVTKDEFAKLQVPEYQKDASRELPE